MRQLAFLSSLIILVSSVLEAQGAPVWVLRGRVVDAYSTYPVVTVRVVLTSDRDTVGDARTDSAGYFEARAAAPSGWAHFVRLGYRPDSARWEISEIPLRVAMNPLAVPATLAAVNVRAGVSAFNQRMRRARGGRFITPERIADIKPMHTSEVLRGLAGVRLLDSAGTIQVVGHRAVRVKPSKAAPTRQTKDADAALGPAEGENCAMRVGVDGKIMMPGFSINDVRVEEVYAVEVYTGVASMPAEFAGIQSNASCGLVLIWTKVGRERP